MKLVVRTPQPNSQVMIGENGIQIIVGGKPVAEIQMVGEFATSVLHKAKESFRLKNLAVVAASYMDGDDDPVNFGVMNPNIRFEL